MDNDQKKEAKSWDKTNTEYIAKEVVGVYTNNASINLNNWDASLVFGEIQGEKDGKLIISPRVKVTMSLQFAKALRDLLDENLADFEDKFGEIQEFAPKPTSQNKEKPVLASASRRSKK